MNSSRAPRTTDILTKLPGFASLFALAGGAAVILGWSLGIAGLTRMLPGFAPASMLTGIAMLLSGAALWLVRDAEAGTFRRLVSAGLAVFVAAIAVAAIGERVTSMSVDWARLGQRVAATPGLTQRLPINTAWGFFLVAIGIWTLCSRKLARSRAPQWLGLAIFLTGFFALVGRAFGVSAFYSPMPGQPMSLWAMFALQLLGIGVVFARRWFGFAALLMDKGPGGKLARRLLPPAIAMPFVVGWAAVIMERAGIYGTEVGSSFFAVTIVLAFTWMVMRAARAVQRADAERLLERRRQLVLEPRRGLGGLHPADIDTGDRHALGDQITARIVVRVHAQRPGDQEDDESRDDDECPASHGDSKCRYPVRVEARELAARRHSRRSTFSYVRAGSRASTDSIARTTGWRLRPACS